MPGGAGRELDRGRSEENPAATARPLQGRQEIKTVVKNLRKVQAACGLHFCVLSSAFHVVALQIPGEMNRFANGDGSAILPKIFPDS